MANEKKEKRTLREHVVPTLKGAFGKIGSVLAEGLILVEDGAKAAREALDEKLTARINEVSVTAGAAANDAKEAKKSSAEAAADARQARGAAEMASTSASEAAGRAEAMQEDVRAAAEAKAVASEAKGLAQRAFKAVNEVLGALNIEVQDEKGSTIKKEGKEAVDWLLQKVSGLLSAYGTLESRITERQEQTEDKVVDLVESIRVELQERIDEKLAGLRREVDQKLEATENKMADVLGGTGGDNVNS